MIVWGLQLWKPNMRKLITTIALLALIGGPAAIAQTGTGGSSVLPKNPQFREAPIGHRQPHADQVPSEKNPMNDPDDSIINQENAAFDRMMNGICRGC
jgi:hypothetical protein